MGAHSEFPRQQARTRRFTLGVPRALTVAPDGSYVAFVRSAGGDDPVGRLWVLDTASGEEHCVADPVTLGTQEGDDLPAEEQARRERAREAAGGIVGYATDADVDLAAFALGGRLYGARLTDAGSRGTTAWRHPTEHAVIDPRPDPTGRRIAYVCEGALWVADAEGGEPSRLVDPADSDSPAMVMWGLAEFIAAEEMGRTRGFWWAPDGERLAVACVDESPVTRWHLGDPAEPDRPPTTLAYPAAGTPNADVSLFVIDLAGQRVRVDWDRQARPYLVDVVWDHNGPLTLVVQSRDQRHVDVLAADPDTGRTDLVRSEHDERWVELVAGSPRWSSEGQLVHTVDSSTTRRLAFDGEPVTPEELQVRRIVQLEAAGVLVAASVDPTTVGLWWVTLDGGEPEALTPPTGLHQGRAGGGTLVVQSRGLDDDGVTTVVTAPGGRRHIRSLAETPLLTPNVTLASLGDQELRSALVLPTGFDPAVDSALPVLLDPYGGPHAQRALAARSAFGVAQWFADAGFAVLITDGRGSPGRGPAWERAIAGDLATVPLTDQLAALQAAAERYPGLDLERVGIRGWSFGGYLAALAVLRRPDAVHAAVAGAPVTDWSLYDTHYTERYLGTPDEQPDAYRHSSLLGDAAGLTRPLLLIHGLADDNVVAAHTLRLSAALLAEGRPHRVLPLSGVTHMTSQTTVAEQLLWLQLDFLQEALNPRPLRR